MESEIPTEILTPKNFDTISDSSLETQRPDAILLARPPDENSPSENNGHRCATGRAEPDLKSLMPSLQDPDGKECAEAGGPISNNAANNDLATETTAEEKETLGNNNEKESASSSGGENIINFSPSIETIRDSSSNEQSPIEKESSTSKDLPPNSTTPVDSESADQLSDLCVVELGEAADLVVDEETASNDRDDANGEVERPRRLEEGGVTEDVAIAPAAPPPNELTGRGEGKGEHNTPSALTDERDKSGPKRAGRLKGRKRGGVEGKHKKSMTRVRDKAESSATSEARIAHEFPRHNWLMKHLMAEQQLVTNRKDPESRKSPTASEKDQADPNGEQCKQEEEEEKTPGEVDGTVVVKDKRRSKQQGKLSRDSSLESFTSLDTLSSTDKLEGENDNVFRGPVSPTTTEETGQQEVSQPKSHSPKLSIAEKSTEDSETVDDRRGSSDKGLSTEESAAVNSSDTQAEAPQTSARQSQEEPLNLSLKAARFVDFYNSIGSKNIAKAAAEGGEVEAGASTASEHVNDGAESPADRGVCTEPPAVPSATLDAGLKKEDLPISSKDECASTEQSSPIPAASQSGSYTPITVTVHTAVPKANITPPQASDPAKSSPETQPPQVPAMGNVQDRPMSRNNTSMFSFEDVPKDQRAPRQDGHHQGAAPKRPASPTVRCPPRKRSTVDSGVVCLSPYSPVSPSDKTTSPAAAATKLYEETVPKRRGKTASLPETATASAPYQFAVPSQQAVLPSKKSQALRSSSSGGQERPSVISVVPVTPPLPPRPSAPPPPPHDTPYRGDHSVTAALLARLEVMTKNKVNIERELVNQELLLTELRKRSLEDKSGLLRKQSQEKEALLFHMRMTYNKLCEDIDYLMRSGPTKFADGQKSTHSTAPNSTAPNSIGPSSQAIPIHRAQSDSAITLQAGGKIGGETGNRWRETASNERRSSDGENSSDVQIIGQKGPTMSSSLQDFRHVNPHVNPPPYLDPRYVTDPRQAALMYANTTAGQQYPAISTVAQNHISPRSVAAPRFSPYAQAQSDLAAATAAERRRQAHMDVKRAKQILNEHKSFVEKYSRPPGPGELAGNPHNITTGSEVQLNPPVNTAIPQASVQGGVPTSTVHPYPHGGVPIHPAVTMAQVIPILPGDPSFAPRSTAMAAHMVAPDQRPLPAMTHQGMPPFYYISPGMPVPAGYQQQPIPGQSPRVLNPVTQQLLSPPPGQQTPTSTTPSQLNNLRGVHHRPPNATSIVNSKEPPPAAQHHPVLLPGKPSPGQMCHHQQLQQYGWPGQLPTNSAEMNAAYFAAHAAQHAAVQSRAEAAMKRGGSSVKDHLQRPNVVALPEMQQAAYLSKHFKPFSVTGPPENSIMHPSKTHPVHLQQARTQPKDLITRVGQQTAREAAYLQDIQGYLANHQPASVFRGNPMMRGPGVVENGQGSPGTMVGPPRRDTGGGVVSIADDEYHSCVVCNKEATFLCSGCRKAWYCSPTCQVQAWEKHSEDCL
ncbi:PREDICTED: uncharacterized protein LOC109465978 [Branchiostoma belcheri]|uniref:Uncharacterized protein LOC109465978 n=1 Tax=Branchiostoma belcheri TaxID=7741 RepID=A0A6P4YK25_BRABE|nr:PREDICTED: uncharacterized protein LOC109465978 [Branchiostoma belcheri]